MDVLLTQILERLGGIEAQQLATAERIARIEANAEWTRKALEGNGKKGVIERVDILESERDEAKGKSSLKTTLIAAIAVLASIISASAAVWAQMHHAVPH